MKRKFKQWWSTHLKQLNTKRPQRMTGNPGSGLGQAHKYWEVKPVNRVPNPLSVIIRSQDKEKKIVSTALKSKHYHKNEWQHQHGQYNVWCFVGISLKSNKHLIFKRLVSF